MKNMKKIKTTVEPEEPEPQNHTFKSGYLFKSGCLYLPKMRVKPRSKKK